MSSKLCVERTGRFLADMSVFVVINLSFKHKDEGVPSFGDIHSEMTIFVELNVEIVGRLSWDNRSFNSRPFA